MKFFSIIFICKFFDSIVFFLKLHINDHGGFLVDLSRSFEKYNIFLIHKAPDFFKSIDRETFKRN